MNSSPAIPRTRWPRPRRALNCSSSARAAFRIGGFTVGSVGLSVLAHAERPVVLVRALEAAADEHETDPTGVPSAATPFRPVVLGLDIEHPDETLIEFAFESARRRGSALHVVHSVVDVPPDAVDGPEPLAEHEHLVTATLRPWCEKFPGVPVSETVSAGRAAPQLVRASTRACLVVVGRRTRDARLGPHIGSVAHAVLHHVACPVAVVPHA